MARFCRECGVELAEGAQFCRMCGAKVTGTKPARRFCSACGRELMADAAFCPACGAKATGTANPTPNRAARNSTPAPVSPVQPAYVQTAQRPAAQPKVKKGGRGLSLFLSLVLVAEFCIAGFKYPGFLKKEGGSVTDDLSEYADEIPLRYTKKQIDSALTISIDVSPWEPVADFGQVKVELDEWSLDNENDTLTMRELPELSEGEEGWVLKAYDFSLGSGQDEFATDITITLPRTHPGTLSRCVWFNEETGEWENIYFEVSEDESSYLVYTDHFSKYGVVYYRFNPNTMTLDVSGGRIDLNDGVFVEVKKKGEDNRMCWPVKVDYERLWYLYQKTTDDDIQNFYQDIEAIMKESDAIAANQKIYDGMDYLHNLVGEVDSVKGAFTLPKELSEYVLENKVKPEVELLDKFLFCYDALMTSMKICVEARRGNDTVVETLMNMPTAVYNHKEELAGLTVTAAAATYLAPWLAALVGVTCWTVGKLYEIDTGYGAFTDPTLETIHQYFCTLPTTEMVYGDEISDINTLKTFLDEKDGKNKKKKQTVPMYKISSMTDEDFKILKKEVAKKPLRRYPEGSFKTATAWYECYTAGEAGSEIAHDGWAEAFTVILTLCGDDPEYLQAVLDEFYWNYAYAFWRLDKEYILDPICSRFWSTAEEGTLMSLEQVNGGKKVKVSDKTKCTEDFVNLLKQETKPILQDVLETMQHKSFDALMKEMDKKVLPLLNCMLTFHAVDENLPVGASFQNSLYCQDWTTIIANRPYVRGDAGLRYDSPDLITPMRFDAAKEACFLPLLPSYKKAEDNGVLIQNTVKNYYPYTADFIPKPAEKGDVVYRCTYYHYLMMGAPKVMFFKDVSKKSFAKDEAEIPGKIVMPDLATPVSKVVTDTYRNKKHKITEMAPVKKADVQVIIPQSTGGVFKFQDWIDYNLSTSGDDASTRMLVYLEEALKTMEFTLGEDGSFTAYGSVLYDNNEPRHDINNSIFPEAEVLYGEEPFHPVWEEGSVYDSLHAELSGTVDRKMGTGSVSLTASLSHSQTHRTGDAKGKVQSSSTSSNGTLEGLTPYVTVSESGTEITIRFISDGGNGLSCSYSTTHSDSSSSTGKEDWDLTIIFKKVK
ncbi:MAG: zinc ribbon domain-containing protein [Clostridia bacterium]|nr:zinc ribbon domain-containing protein [Clostridia bacterium]